MSAHPASIVRAKRENPNLSQVRFGINLGKTEAGGLRRNT